MNGYDAFKPGYPRPVFGGGWLAEDVMRTCPCDPATRGGIIQNRPSGIVICRDCGLPLPLQSPPAKERP